jgi:aspartyl/asparaginyl beta-hydroxylase (cupin superfamily)
MIIEKKIPLKRKIFKYLFQKPLEILIDFFSPISNKSFYNATEFPWIKMLEEASCSIQKEFLAITKSEKLLNVQDVFSNESPIAWEENWKVYFIYLYWHLIEEHVQQCPNTTAAIKKIPGIVSAFFSILAPGKEIPEHVGPYNGVLHCHVGLIIPNPPDSCGLRVGKDVRYWSPGEILVFNDTHPHTAWNHSEEGYRVVLFIDFLRPLPFFIRHINKLFYLLISKDDDIQEGLNSLKNNQLTLTRTYF